MGSLVRFLVLEIEQRMIKIKDQQFLAWPGWVHQVDLCSFNRLFQLLLVFCFLPSGGGSKHAEDGGGANSRVKNSIWCDHSVSTESRRKDDDGV